MAHEKKRTPGSVERHAANRAANEARATTNRLRLVGSPSQFGSRGERPSRVLRRIERAQRVAEVPEGGDAA